SIVKLGLRIMVFYNESGYPQDIVDLYNSEDESVRKEAIMASGELFISGAEDELISRFERETKPNQIEILKTLAAIGTEASENFLNQILGQRLDPDIKLVAAYSLNAVNPGCFKNLENYTDAVRKMVLQVKDPHI
ncbi:MAG TPA: HEAT repeat domain-containing protein, partial [Flavobacterium sp.]|nr:HEAT repeat domain-containing protein [Flavobacterium sp.]